MSKFGLDLDLEPKAGAVPVTDLASKLASFPPSAPKTAIDLKVADEVAAQHGFVSREAAPRRRRRTVPSEPKRQLSILMPISRYDRFVAYADLHRLTYDEAIAQLLDQAHA